MSSKNWKLSPSDFTFLWEECKRCFYLKVVHDFPRPSPPMPKIFTVIHEHLGKYFDGKSTAKFLPALPNGVFKFGEKWVQSSLITVSGHASSCYIRGRFDSVVEFDQGGYAIIDFKTTPRKDEHVPLYGRQLHAYAYALENAAAGKLALTPIKRLGLLVFEPNDFSFSAGEGCALTGGFSWVEVRRNDKGFLTLLGDVLDVLEETSPPAGAANCKWCGYRDTARRTKL